MKKDELLQNFITIWDEKKQNVALVSMSAKDMTFDSIAQLLVDHWGLPIWTKNMPIGYDLQNLHDSQPLDLTQRLKDLSLEE